MVRSATNREKLRMPRRPIRMPGSTRSFVCRGISHALLHGTQLSWRPYLRNGLVVATELTQATGTGEREAAIAMVEDLPGSQRITLAADKAYDTADFVTEMRRLGVTPHVTQNTKGRRSAIDGRTTRHLGYAVSLQVVCVRRAIAEPRWSAGCSP